MSGRSRCVSAYPRCKGARHEAEELDDDQVQDLRQENERPGSVCTLEAVRRAPQDAGCWQAKERGMIEQYWMVHNPARHAPVAMHRSYDSALHEAQRLARENCGETFFVLEAVTRVAKRDVDVTDLRAEADEPPF